MIGIIPLDVFNLDVAVFADDAARCAALREEGCDVSEHDEDCLASAHIDTAGDGSTRLSMVIKPVAAKATWAHECVHIADFVMNRLGIPMGVENTEIRAYLTGHLFAGLEGLLP
jgi:hypothetical protein